MSFVVRVLMLSAVLWLAACGGGGQETVVVNIPVKILPVTVEVLGTGIYKERYSYQRLRINKPGRRTSYAIWFPAPQASASAKAAAVLMTDPYAGIDWTGEQVDDDAFKRAGTQDFVMIEDLDGPYAKEGLPIYTPYDYSTIDNAAGGAIPYLMNGVGVIVVYERFYAGGDLQDHIDATVGALEFLATVDSVDTQRIGVWGSSYGGSLALHAAAQAPTGVVPAFGALSTPLVDYQKFVPYAEWMETNYSDRGKAILRLEPFRRRAVYAATPATGAAADYTAYTTSTLVKKLKTRFLFIHDDFDTISPLEQAQPLYFDPLGQHQVFIYPHMGQAPDRTMLDITHGPVKPGYDEASAILFSQSYLLARLVSAGRQEILLPRLNTLDPTMFAYLHAQQALGYEAASFVLPRLIELCDARVRMVDYADDFTAKETGTHFVAHLLRTYWGLDVDEGNVLGYLKTKGLGK